jgi:hypothetical protein
MMSAGLVIPGKARHFRPGASGTPKYRIYPHRPQGDDGWQGGASGVREPRRPRPNPPVGAMALDEPGEQGREGDGMSGS